jgi:hypothetical protein
VSQEGGDVTDEETDAQRLKVVDEALGHAIGDLRQMTAERDAALRLVERFIPALEFYGSMNVGNPNEGPWGARSNDYGHVARVALEVLP